MAAATIEQRVESLERAVRGLQEAINIRQPAPDWLDLVIGSMKDEPAFDEVLAHARAIRAPTDPRSRHEVPPGYRSHQYPLETSRPGIRCADWPHRSGQA